MHTLATHPQHSKATPQSRGVTLVELVAAIVVLSIAIPASVLMLRDQQTRTLDPLMASRAAWLAEEKMEQILADRASQVLGFAHLVPSNYPDESSGLLHEGFTRHVTIENLSQNLQTTGDSYKRITVEVRWDDALGEPRSVRISTVVTDLVEEVGV